MSFDSGILDEFSLEARELLDDAEDSLLKLNGEGNYNEIYNSVFRAFHSLKGSSGMMGFDALQSHLHLLEDYLQKSKGNIKHFTDSVDYYLSGIDAARKILNGENVSFKYEVFSDSHKKAVVASDQFIFLCILKNHEKSVVSKITEVARGLSATVIVVEFEKADNEFLLKERYSALISDLPFLSLKERIPVKKQKRPFLFLSQDVDHVNNLDHAHFYSFSESEQRLKSIIGQLLLEEKNIELYDRARGLMMYMFSDMEDYLLKNNKNEIHKSITSEIRDFVKKFGK